MDMWLQSDDDAEAADEPLLVDWLSDLEDPESSRNALFQS